MSLLATVPLLITLLTCLGATFYVLRRKSLAQSICVQQAARMQNDLAKPLEKLLKMNSHATNLRAARQAADDGVESARMSAYPPAIVAAQAIQTSVILQQTAFHAKQLALLAEAQRIRDEGQRELRSKVAKLQALQVQSQVFYYRPLAVEPRPTLSLSPNYETIPLFSSAQQQRYRYQIDLLAQFPGLHELGLSSKQLTECSVTLNDGGDSWDVQILAAKAQ